MSKLSKYPLIEPQNSNSFVVTSNAQQAARVSTPALINYLVAESGTEGVKTVDGVALMKARDYQLDDTVLTSGYYSPNDGGGALYRIVAGGTGTDDGGSYHDLDNGLQAELIAENEVLVIQYGADPSGVSDSENQIAAACNNPFGYPVRIPRGTYNLASNVVVSSNIRLTADIGVDFTGAGLITGVGIADQSILSKTNGWTSSVDSTTTTGFGDFISYRKDGAPTAASESDALLVIAETYQDATTFDADIVGIGARAYIPSSNPNGRAFALNTYARITAGGDGLLYGAEFNIENGGTDNAVPDTQKAKYGLNITTKPGSNPATAAVKFGSGSRFHYGLWAAPNHLEGAANDRFIELKDLFSIDVLGRVSIGTKDTEELLRVKASSGRAQVFVESDGAGGEASTRYTDTGTRNWTAGFWFNSGRYSISTTSNLSTNKVFEIDANGNFGLNGFDAAGGQGSVFIANASVVPTANPTGGGVLYVEGGALKFRGSSGTITTIAPA